MNTCGLVFNLKESKPFGDVENEITIKTILNTTSLYLLDFSESRIKARTSKNIKKFHKFIIKDFFFSSSFQGVWTSIRYYDLHAPVKKSLYFQEQFSEVLRL